MKIVNPIEAFASWWGDRSWITRTLGTPARTRLMTHFSALASDAEAFAKFRGNDELKLPELEKLAKFMAEGWRSEGGWDTLQGIRGIEAATAVRQNQLAKADLNDLP